MEEYKKAQEHLAVPNATPIKSMWQPPPPDMYKLNFDAVVFLYLNCFGFRAIIRNAAGEVMAGMSVKGPT